MCFWDRCIELHVFPGKHNLAGCLDSWNFYPTVNHKCALQKNNYTKWTLGSFCRTSHRVGKQSCCIYALISTAGLLTAAEAVWETSSLFVTDSWPLSPRSNKPWRFPHTRSQNHHFQSSCQTRMSFGNSKAKEILLICSADCGFWFNWCPMKSDVWGIHACSYPPVSVHSEWVEMKVQECWTFYLQFVSFEGSVVQQVKASVVLLGEVNVGHQHQDLNDVAEIFRNGVMERRVPIWILIEKEKLSQVVSQNNADAAYF